MPKRKFPAIRTKKLTGGQTETDPSGGLGLGFSQGKVDRTIEIANPDKSKRPPKIARPPLIRRPPKFVRSIPFRPPGGSFDYTINVKGQGKNMIYVYEDFESPELLKVQAHITEIATSGS